MITIIHGDDLSASRNYLYTFRKDKEIQIYNGETVTLTDLTQHLDGSGLFEEHKYILIENLLAKRKKSKESEAITSYLQAKTLEHEIILWEGKELEKRVLSRFAHATIKAFKIPQTVFQLLDNIRPGNGKILVKLLQQTLESTDVEFVFFMLIRQVRILLALKETSPETIDEVKRMALWQQSKLEKQAKLFATDQLLSLHTKLFEIDRDMKTGELSVPLNIAIDILLVEL